MAASADQITRASVGPPAQLDLFQRLVPAAEKIYTQSLELWDQAPKVVLGPPVDGAGKAVPKGSQYLPIQTRIFVHHDQKMFVEIAPARLRDRRGVERDALPGLREMVVEQAVRKIAIHQHRLFETDNARHGKLIGARFRIGEVCNDLGRLSHTYAWSEVREALLVASGAIITIRHEGDGKIIARAPIFPAVSLPAENNDGIARVAFHPLVAVGINATEYRQLYYDAALRLRSSIARWIHRRMAHRFRQAGYADGGYHLLATTIVRESGLCGYSRSRDRLRAIDDAISELRTPPRHVLLPSQPGSIVSPSREGEARMKGRCWDDTLYILRPSPSFVEDVKLANIADKLKV